MNIKYFTIVLFIIAFISCKDNQDGTNNVVSEDEKTSISLDEIRNNKFVEIGKLQHRSVKQTVNCTGQTELTPNAMVSVHSKIDGAVSSIRYNPGDYVKKGSLLLWIQNQGLISKQNDYLISHEKYLYAKSEWDRKKDLYKEKVLPEKDRMKELTELNILKTNFLALEKELIFLGIDPEKLRAEKSIQDRIPVHAPITGIIQEINVHKGQWLESNHPILHLVDIDQIILKLNVLARDAVLIKSGMNVDFTIAGSEQSRTAKVKNINPVYDRENGSKEVYCTLDKNSIKGLSPGMFVNAQIHGEEKILKGLPLDAVIKEGQNYFVYIISNDELTKQQLDNPIIQNDFCIIDLDTTYTFVKKGAYYIE